MTPPELSTSRSTGLRGEHPVASVPGVGARRAEVFAKLGVVTVADLLRLSPKRFEDRRHVSLASELVPGRPATFIGRVESSRTVRARGGLVIVEATLADDAGRVRARWFNQPWLRDTLAVGARILLHGDVTAKGDTPEFESPAVERPPASDDELHPGCRRLVPVHPTTAGLSVQGVRRDVWSALGALTSLDDPLPRSVRDEVGLPTLLEAIRRVHFPESSDDAERARRRLAFDELFVHEMLLARRKASRMRSAGPAFRFTGTLHRRIRARFPFPLTPAQNRVVADLARDLSRPVPMNRLLQGDVGSGKTVVAAYACLAAAANGWQSAFMAPTEVLARQHEATLRSWLAGSDVGITGLYGGVGAKERREARASIASGEAKIVVGTHAVLSKGVEFARLGLVVVDEQHKFGVKQRRELVSKGPVAGDPGVNQPGTGQLATHCLVMTATPIPRSLALVVFGDLDYSVLDGKPPGIGARTTWLVKPADGERVFTHVRDELRRGRQAYVVYPLVEESETLSLKDATAGHAAWTRALPERRVGLVHGRLKSAERLAVLDAFRRRKIDVLVATVVVEVGIDVANATVLVVEHAERFGLSQLHQLRGRVGRGAAGGLCVLMDRSEGSTPERLQVLEATDDGFRIAEEDLRLRGAGDFFGTRQHGAPAFLAARLPEDLPLLAKARAAATRLVARGDDSVDPSLVAMQAWVRAEELRIGDPVAGG